MTAPDPQQSEPDKAPTLLQATGSVLASFFGVQSRANRERDFKHGKPLHFIIIGLLMTAAFIATVMVAVKIALSQAS